MSQLSNRPGRNELDVGLTAETRIAAVISPTETQVIKVPGLWNISDGGVDVYGSDVDESVVEVDRDQGTVRQGRACRNRNHLRCDHFFGVDIRIVSHSGNLEDTRRTLRITTQRSAVGIEVEAAQHRRVTDSNSASDTRDESSSRDRESWCGGVFGLILDKVVTGSWKVWVGWKWHSNKALGEVELVVRTEDRFSLDTGVRSIFCDAQRWDIIELYEVSVISSKVRALYLRSG